jgi:hypothetical protein
MSSAEAVPGASNRAASSKKRYPNSTAIQIALPLEGSAGQIRLAAIQFYGSVRILSASV